MTGGDLKEDMVALASERCNNLARIGKFPRRIKQIFRAKVTEKADGMLYVDLALHHLDSIGREGPIRQALDKLPTGMQALFPHIIAELYQDRSQEAQRAVKKLYTWLIYVKRPLSVAEANQIVSLAANDLTLKVEDEIWGRLARLLDLAQNDGDDSDLLEDDSTASGNDDNDDNDISESLYFQEKAFQDFLKEQESRTERFAEHRMSLRAICASTDLCQECYNKRQARNMGEDPTIKVESTGSTDTKSFQNSRPDGEEEKDKDAKSDTS